MQVEIRVPTLGESLVEATVGKWLKRAGEPVMRGEALVELETDKVNVEVTAEQGGVLGTIAAAEGASVKIGEVLGTIAVGDGAAAPPAPAVTPAAAGAPAAHQAPAAAPIAPPPDGDRPSVAATPVARRIAGQHGVDLGSVQGSGPSGRIVKDDVVTAIASPPSGLPAPARTDGGTAPPSQAAPLPQPAARAPQPAGPTLTIATTGERREERRRMSRRRQTIAQRLVEAQHTAAMLTTFNEVDMSAIMAVRARRKDSFKARHGVGLGFMSFFTRAVIGALKAFPLLNAEIQGDEIVVKHYYDIGVAVGTDEGLVVPVVREADRKSFAAIEREIADLAARARDGKLTLAELQGGTFTITNGGIYGSLMSTPILNYPQVGILGMHKIEERPIVTGGEIVIRPMMYLALSYDHRIVDGSEAVRFLVRIKELLEDPEALLLEG